jgi:hypothetical protein
VLSVRARVFPDCYLGEQMSSIHVFGVDGAAIHYLVRRNGRFVVALGMGGMGYSFGAGLRMAFAWRRRRVECSPDEIPPFAPFVATPKKQLVFAEPVNETAVSINQSITKETV